MSYSSSVPASFQGYYYQICRLFSRLWGGDDGDIICLEHYDDLALKKKNGLITLEQAKQYTTATPASNWSPAFWKTIENWIQVMNSYPKSRNRLKFVYCCSTKKSPGELILQYHNASSKAQAQEAILKTQSLLNSSRLKKNKDKLLNLIQNPLLILIITNFEFIHEDPTKPDGLDKLIKDAIPNPIQANQVKVHLLGWICDFIREQFKQGRVMAVPRNEFRKEYLSYWNRLKADPLSSYSLASEDICSESDKEKYKKSTFIEQLNLIECSNKDKELAIIDFVTAGNTWARMAADGVVNEESYQIFRKEIQSDWKNIKDITVNSFPPESLDKKRAGRLIYNKTLLLKTKLQGQDSPRLFVRGTCQDLADRLLIGWHPDYERELKNDSGNN